MKKFPNSVPLALCVLLLMGGCSRKSGGGVKLNDEADSVAYVIGLNVGQNLLRMDSTLDAAVVALAIRDVFAGTPRMTSEQAQGFYLRYVNYSRPEKVRAYEERFLADFARNNRSYARTKSGLTYAVEEVGDEALTPRMARDTVSIRFRTATMNGQEIESSWERGDTLRAALGDLLPGVQESLKLIGKGGKIEAWFPAALAYGAEGDATLGVEANQTLFFEIELIDLERPDERTRQRSRSDQQRYDF